MKHTKGPWFALQYGPYWNIQTVDHYEEGADLLDDQDTKEAEANARLIASSPDLLEALQDILKVWPDCLKSTGELETHLHAKALAAVKKATEG